MSYLFAIDVSYSSVSSGLLQLIINSLRRVLNEFPMDNKIGIMTFDSTVHFYNLNVSRRKIFFKENLFEFFFIEMWICLEKFFPNMETFFKCEFVTKKIHRNIFFMEIINFSRGGKKKIQTNSL